MKILIYTFFGHHLNCYKILKDYLQTEVFYKHILKPFSTADEIIPTISNFDFIIGIADHTKTALHSRIDPIYINKYGRNKIKSESSDFYKSNFNFDKFSLDNFYIFKSYTNGPCNRTAYLIMKEIKEKKLLTKFCFFHLSKKNVAEDLDEIISKLQEMELP